jgi:putative ABC transport system ATP-binding protein
VTHPQLSVQLKSVVKTYSSSQSEVRALRGVSANFAKGSFTAIMGPSGSGKSTLLQCACGLERVTSGEVYLGGKNISKLDETQLTLLRREQVGFIFQAFNLVQSISVAENVVLPMRLAGRTLQPQEMANALSQVGLDDRAHHLPSQLSGGQQQRVAIARAIIAKPQVLFADEPTGALDTSRSKEILALLRRVVDETGQTIILVTHDPVVASRADRVLFLADGQLHDQLEGPSAQAIAKKLAELGH